MNKTAVVPTNKSDVLPDTGEFEQDYESVKLISQEIIEQKEAIIQQIYKQLKDSIRTIDVLTGKLETYKQNQTQEINLAELQQNGFLRKENDHYFIIADVTKAIHANRQCIKIDPDLQIINETISEKIQTKFQTLQSGYLRAMQQCDTFLKALSQKQEKEDILKKEIQSLKIREAELTEQSSRIKEQLELLTIQYNEHKKQQHNQKLYLIKQRQQICLQLSELKKLPNKQSQRTTVLAEQNKELKQTISLLEERIKSYELQKMERDYYQSDLIRSYKKSIRYVDYEAQCPSKEESTLDKENKFNLANKEIKQIKSDQHKEILNLARIDSIMIDQRPEKTAQRPFQVISPTQSKQLSPSRQHPIDQQDLNNFHYDSFPQANTVEKHAQKDQEEIKFNSIQHKQGKLNSKKQRKVIRINY